MAKTQGGSANSSGRILEQSIASTLKAKGFDIIPYTKWQNNNAAFGDEILLTRVPYTTIYGHSGYTEFLLKSKQHNLEIRIECKWQQSAGSVDEKFPYLYLSCIESMPEKDIFIVVDGGGYKDGALTWLKNAAKNRLYDNLEKNIRVLSLAEFISWANRL